MELLEGQTLRQALEAGPLTAKRATEYARQIAEGLAAAHAKGIVHRDLKPENVFVTRDGHVKILDFGLARQVAPVGAGGGQTTSPTMAGRTEPGMVMGTVGYMAPEQVRGDAVDHRADIFAFGVVLFEMLAGKRPFEGATGAETMTAILREEPPPVDVDPRHGAGVARARGGPLPREAACEPVPIRTRPRVRARRGQQHLGTSSRRRRRGASDTAIVAHRPRRRRRADRRRGVSAHWGIGNSRRRPRQGRWTSAT